MTDQQLALRAVGEVQRRVAACNPPRPPHRLTKPISLLVLTACVAALAITGAATARAKQQCSAAPMSRHNYWSWRLVDGRKCWYEGKPMLSKSLLEWPARATAAPDPRRELAHDPPVKADDALDAQAYAPNDSATFDALWQDRIEKH